MGGEHLHPVNGGGWLALQTFQGPKHGFVVSEKSAL